MTAPQPYTKADLETGERIVRELHGLKGFNAWAEHIAQAIAEPARRPDLSAGISPRAKTGPWSNLPCDKDLTDDEAATIGKTLRDAPPGNLVVGSFAAELIGESYPFTKEQAGILFDHFTDAELGRKFAEWCERH